ncbi:MAG TPA: hypothetical protein VGA73_06435 [Candidatus Binatia bacterium]
MFEMFRKRNGKPAAGDPLEILKESRRDLVRLADQIARHAEKAPYPHMAAELRRMAGEKRASADLLGDKVPLAGPPEESPLDLPSGKNHWERMAQDLNDQNALDNRLVERAARLRETAPELADRLERIAASDRRHAKLLMDLIARADPQADQT